MEEKEIWFSDKRYSKNHQGFYNVHSKIYFIICDGKSFEHRKLGPCYVRDGTKIWYLHDKNHRIDGPSYEKENITKQWWFFGKRFKEETYWNQ